MYLNECTHWTVGRNNIWVTCEYHRCDIIIADSETNLLVQEIIIINKSNMIYGEFGDIIRKIVREIFKNNEKISIGHVTIINFDHNDCFNKMGRGYDF